MRFFRKMKWPGRVLFVLLFGMSVLPIFWRPLVGFVLLGLTLFLETALLPEFRHRENLGVAFLIFLFGMPSMIFFAYRLYDLMMFYENRWAAALSVLLIAFVVICVTEIIFGLIARLIWRKQYRFQIL